MTSSTQIVRMSVGKTSPRLEVTSFRRNGTPPLNISLSEWPRAEVPSMMNPRAFEARFSSSLTRLRLPGLKVSKAVMYSVGKVRIISKSATTVASRDGRVTHVQFIVALVRAPNGRAVLFVGDGAGPVEGPVDAILRSVRFD